MPRRRQRGSDIATFFGSWALGADRPELRATQRLWLKRHFLEGHGAAHKKEDKRRLRTNSEQTAEAIWQSALSSNQQVLRISSVLKA